MKRVSPRSLPLLASVCLFLLALVLPSSASAQSKSASKGKKTPPADKTLSSTEAAPPVIVAPKSAAGPNAALLAPLELEIIDEVNLARMEPQQYAAFVEEYKKYYKGNQLMLPGYAQPMVTVEGGAAVDEAINFLRASKPLPPLQIVKGLCLAAKDHALDLAVKGTTGHKGSDGSTPNTRMDRYGNWENVTGESIVYDVTTARQIVIGMIIDDGVSNRGHRRNIFESKHLVAGININTSPPHGAKCVINFSGGFHEKTAGAVNRKL